MDKCFYSYREGWSFPVNAQDAGEALATIQQRQGKIVPANVVESAKPEDSPLHPAFEWDDTRAGEKYRESQARILILAIRKVDPDMQADEAPRIAFLHVRDVSLVESVGDEADDSRPARMGAYYPSELVRSRVDMWERAVADLAGYVKGTSRRVAELSALAKTETQRSQITRVRRHVVAAEAAIARLG